MSDNGLRPYLHAKTRAIFSRFAGVEMILSSLTSRNPAPVLESLRLDTAPPSINGLAAEEAEMTLHRHFILRLARMIPKHSGLFPLFRALVMEYEIRNVALFLKHDTSEDELWYPLVPGCGLFGKNTFALSRETVKRLLDTSPYRNAARSWAKTHDTSQLDAALEGVYCQGLGKTIAHIPGNDRDRIQNLYRQRISLKFTLEALRMQRSYGIKSSQILAQLPFPSGQLRSEIEALLAIPRFEHPADALPHWARAQAYSLIHERPGLMPRKPDPELGLADLSSLEKLAANLMLRQYRSEFRVYGAGYAPFYCFYYLFKRELQNIMLLLNGIRFGIGSETLKAELIV